MQNFHGTDCSIETAIPWKVFSEAGFETRFATEDGKRPTCDEMMLSGMTATVLGANQAAKQAYQSLCEDVGFQKPMTWTAASFNLDKYDLVFLPGGHEKGVRQIIDSKTVHQLLVDYFPKTQRPSNRTVAAICHGVQVLAASTMPDGKSVMHDAKTTALPGFMEQSIYQATRLFLGDYYKTYGAGSPSVQEIVTKKLDNPSQFENSLGTSP